jgi:hypothetical protein
MLIGRGEFLNEVKKVAVNYFFSVLAAWRSGHRIRHRNRGPGFESRQAVWILGKK